MLQNHLNEIIILNKIMTLTTRAVTEFVIILIATLTCELLDIIDNLIFSNYRLPTHLFNIYIF